MMESFSVGLSGAFLMNLKNDHRFVLCLENGLTMCGLMK